jgi:hypothetical protein
LKKPDGGFTEKLVYVDVPGTLTFTKALGEQKPTSFTLKVEQTVEVLDNANAVIATKKWEITVGVDAEGKLTHKP